MIIFYREKLSLITQSVFKSSQARLKRRGYHARTYKNILLLLTRTFLGIIIFASYFEQEIITSGDCREDDFLARPF